MALVHDTAVRCTGCDAAVSVWEEGLCAFCRMEARGDDQLLSHDSRGYLDHDGVTRVPCGCGCNKPVIVPEERDKTLDDVRDILGHGQEVEIRLPYEPQPWRREWIESLGGRIVIDPEAPMPLALQRDKEDGSMNGDEGRSALDAMDRGEPQRPERSAMANGQKPRGYWTRERVIDSIKRFAEQHGRPPKQDELTAKNDLPSVSKLTQMFGSQSKAIEAAGFEAPKRGEPRKPRRAPQRESEPAPLPVPAAPPEPPAPRPVAADPEHVDVFELFETMATQERIDYYDELSMAALRKRDALIAIRDAVRDVREVEPA